MKKITRSAKLGAYGLQKGAGKGVGRANGLRRNRNTKSCKLGGVGFGKGGGAGKGKGRK